MTICVAAIGKCDELRKGDEAIIFATDHMITIGNIGQFEHSMEKYRKLNQNTIAMLSGEAMLFNDVLEGVSFKDNFDKIINIIHEKMKQIRDDKLKNIIFDKLKINFEYLKELLKEPEHNKTVQEIMNEIAEFKLGTSVIVTGFKDKKAQIVEINELAIVNTRDINFNAIGSGSTQAINTLLFQRHSKDDCLKTTLYNVYKAKRNSEVASGVGKETDLFIMLCDGKFHKMTNEQMKKLDDIYRNEMSFGKSQPQLDEIIKDLGEINA